jgi:lysophospholipase L1-like esterase
MTDSTGESPVRETGNESTRIPFRRRIIYLAIPYLCFLSLLGLVEVGVRLTRPHLLSLDLFVVTTQQKAQVADSKQSTIFEGDPLLLWRLKPNLRNAIWDFTVVSTNAQHLRSDEPLGAKRPGTIRIVCVGDSVTFGYRVPVVWPDKPTEYDPEWLPYPMLLEKLLRAANPNRSIEVINLAVPGYTSHQGLAWLRRDINSLQPDIVTISFGWNDASLSDLPDRQTIQTSWTAFSIRWLIDHSQAFAHASKWLRSGQSTQANRKRPVPRVNPADYLRNMFEMVQLARNRGAPVIVIAAPYRDLAPDAPEGEAMLQNRLALRSLMEKIQVPFLEIRELTQDTYPANEGWFGERIHPNHMGHRLITAELLKVFSSRGMLKDLSVPTLTP